MKKEPEKNQIYINARFLTQPITGVQRYAREVVGNLDALIEQGIIDKDRYCFKMLAPARADISDLELKHIPINKVGYLTGHPWEQIELPLYSRGALLLNLCNTGPLSKSEQIATIFDAGVYVFPQSYTFAFRTWYRILLKGLCRGARRVITSSHFSQQELSKYCGLSREKSRVVYAGKEHVFKPQPAYHILDKFNLQTRPYLLAVSSLSPHKNFNSVIKAVELLGKTDFDIVIAGGANPKVFGTIELSLPEHVKYLGYVDEGELRALYENAACFIFPSFYEGFGLPPLEAMACGSPVIVSMAASLPEVYGDAVLYCDPNSPRDIADKILQVMSNKVLRQSLQKAGLERSRMFSWTKCAMEFYQEIDGALRR